MMELDSVFELLDGIIPKNADKTIFFLEVEDNAYEGFYYSYFPDGRCAQCYELASEGIIDENQLDDIFGRMSDIIKKTPKYQSGKRNVVTICIEGTQETSEIEIFENSVGLYAIKKNWKKENLQ